ncbi:uncharacterized protein [Parasteatoda tepidariorum]|uniref:uncharacterized protein n=1 Tax=Parasteatoda tepidariorum TaxID=114398 RepID=UPI0039BD90E9
MATTSVDYRDFLLVFKAFHLKENAPNGMICRCGLKKEDTVFFNGEETSIPSYDNTFNQYIEENIGSWGSFSRDSFQIETIMVPTCDDDVSSIEKLKNIFLDMSPYKRLVWCGRLLIEFHEENQCSRYLSSALKFYLKAIEYMRSVPFCGIVPIDSKIKELLRLSTKFRVHQSVFLELFRLFIAFECDHSINAVLLLEHLFRAANEFKIDMFALWNKKDITNTSRYYYFFNFLIYRADEFLIQIIKFGKTECISIESRRYLRYLLNELNDYNWGHLDIHVKNDYRYNSTTFRALQTLVVSSSKVWLGSS